MNLGPVTLARPGARPAARSGRRLGQENLLSVQVNRDGVAAPSVAVEVMLADGSMEEGLTDPSGAFNLTYGPDWFGMATIRITPPDGVEDMGEANVQAVDLQGGPQEVLFEMHSVSPGAAPAQTKGIVAGIATVVLLTLFGASV